MKPLMDLAQVIRTKNAGPFELTLDVIFGTGRHTTVKKSNALNAPLIAKIYGVPEEDVLQAIYFDPACVQQR